VLFPAGTGAPLQFKMQFFSKLHVFQGVQESEVSVKSKRKLLLASAWTSETRGDTRVRSPKHAVVGR
jgi:hypothetical protein